MGLQSAALVAGECQGMRMWLRCHHESLQNGKHMVHGE